MDVQSLDSTIDLVEPFEVAQTAGSHPDNELLDPVRRWADGFWAVRINGRHTVGYAIVPPHQRQALKHAYVVNLDGVDLSNWWIDIARLVGSMLDLQDWHDSAWLTRSGRTVALTRISLDQLPLLPAQCTSVHEAPLRGGLPRNAAAVDTPQRRRSDR